MTRGITYGSRPPLDPGPHVVARDERIMQATEGPKDRRLRLELQHLANVHVIPAPPKVPLVIRCCVCYLVPRSKQNRKAFTVTRDGKGYTCRDCEDPT